MTTLRDTRVLYHDLFTNGIVYLDVGFDLHTLPADLLSYVPLFGRALLETGVGNDDFVRLSQRIGRSTGGIRPQRWTSAVPGRPACTAWFNLRGKALPEQTGELLSILQDILARARLDNRERFQQLVLEEKAAVESRLVPAGSSYVDRRLRANFFESRLGRRADGRRQLPVLPAQARRRSRHQLGKRPRRARAHPGDAVQPLASCCATSLRRPPTGTA